MGYKQTTHEALKWVPTRFCQSSDASHRVMGEAAISGDGGRPKPRICDIVSLSAWKPLGRVKFGTSRPCLKTLLRPSCQNLNASSQDASLHLGLPETGNRTTVVIYIHLYTSIACSCTTFVRLEGPASYMYGQNSRIESPSPNT